MALNINTDLGLTSQASAVSSKNTDLVKGDELTRIAKEILTATPKRTTTATNVNSSDVKIFSQGADINLVKQVATNRTGYDVFLSQNTMQAINALKAQAAQSQAQNLTKVVDGKIYVNAEKVDTADKKPTLNINSFQGIQLSESSSLYKDKKGSGGFFVPLEKNKNENTKEGINLII